MEGLEVMRVDDTALSQTDVVVHGIKKMIIDGALGAGDKLPIEKNLAQTFGVSRGPLREGVRALSMMGVLETRQGAGTYVTSLDPSLLLASMAFVVDLQHTDGAVQLHAVRRVLETEAAGRAAMFIQSDALDEAEIILDESERAMTATVVDHDAVLDADIRFHRLIAAGSDNKVLSALIEGLASKTVRARLWRAISDDHADIATLAEHRAILHALRIHDPDRARLRMAAHLLAVEDFLTARGAPVDDSPTASDLALALARSPAT